MQTHGAPWNYEYYIPTSSVAIVTRCVVALSPEASVTFKTSSGSASRSGGGGGGSSRGGDCRRQEIYDYDQFASVRD